MNAWERALGLARIRMMGGDLELAGAQLSLVTDPVHAYMKERLRRGESDAADRDA